MVKPARGGSSLGAVVVRDAADLPNAMVSCFSYDDTALVEQYVDGVEVAVTVLESADGLRALPAVEVVPVHGVFDYAARYTAGETEYHVPARLAEEVAEAVGRAAVTAHQALGLRHLSRSDLIVRDDGTPVFLEVNVAPGMTETSLLPMALEEAGLDLGEVMLDLALRAQRAPRRSGRLDVPQPLPATRGPRAGGPGGAPPRPARCWPCSPRGRVAVVPCCRVVRRAPRAHSRARARPGARAPA